MINWFDMPAEGLSNGGLFEVKELEVTENGTYETKGEMYNKVTVNVEGGGGSSDFSTAQVTLESNSEFVEGVNLSCIKDDGIWVYSDPDTGVYTVPLFNGINNVQLTSLGMNVSVSGSAEMLGAFVRVTGDCTITIS